MQYAEWERECELVMSFLLPLCDKMSRFFVKYMAFTFTSIGSWIAAFAAFAFAFPFAIPFGHMEEPQCVYKLF